MSNEKGRCPLSWAAASASAVLLFNPTFDNSVMTTHPSHPNWCGKLDWHATTLFSLCCNLGAGYAIFRQDVILFSFSSLKNYMQNKREKNTILAPINFCAQKPIKRPFFHLWARILSAWRDAGIRRLQHNENYVISSPSRSSCMRCTVPLSIV